MKKKKLKHLEGLERLLMTYEVRWMVPKIRNIFGMLFMKVCRSKL